MTPTFEDNTKPARQNLREFALNAVRKWLGLNKTVWQRHIELYETNCEYRLNTILLTAITTGAVIGIILASVIGSFLFGNFNP